MRAKGQSTLRRAGNQFDLMARTREDQINSLLISFVAVSLLTFAINQTFSSIASGNDSDFLIEGLTILKNRGYDSAGIATMSGIPSDGLVR